MSLVDLPLVSILIHTYNRKELLTLAIESALAQTVTDFELVIADNASTDGAWEVCQEFAAKDSRVRIFQNEINIGAGFNGLRAMSECRGKYVKILYSDDLMSPDFLEKTLPWIEDPDVGCVFTAAEIGRQQGEGHIYYKFGDRSGRMSSEEFIYYSIFKQGTIVPNSPGASLFRLADFRQHVLMYIPSPEMNDYHIHGMGVDMILYLLTANKYKKIAYVPEALAFFRAHNDSETISSLATRPQKWWFGYQQAKIWFTNHYGYSHILNALVTTEWTRHLSGSNQMSLNEVAARYLFDYPPVTLTDPDLFISDFRHARKCLADFFLNMPTALIQQISDRNGVLGQTYTSLLSMDVKQSSLTTTERIFADKLKTRLTEGFDRERSINDFMAAMLYCQPQELQSICDWKDLPIWAIYDYVKFLFITSPILVIGDADRQADYLQDLVFKLHQDIFAVETPMAVAHELALALAEHSHLIYLYQTDRSYRDLYKSRGSATDRLLNNLNFNLDYEFPTRSAERQKIRVGILKSNFQPNKETYAALPWFEHLDRDRFEIVLYALEVVKHPVVDYCSSRADASIMLSNNLPDRVAAIRDDDLDILIVANNITVGTSPISLLVQHRLARIQLTYDCSPLTTGIPNLDYYVTGKLFTLPTTARSQYCEQLVTLDGCGCLSLPSTIKEIDSRSERLRQRANFDIDNDAIVYISGANFYKISPELANTWAKIIAAVPKSVLVLYPFGSEWSNSYPTAKFQSMMESAFEQQGIEFDRLKILDLQGRANVLNCLQVGDVYLDSYPYAGYASLIDGLQVALPVVVRAGESLKSRRGAGLLRSIETTDLVADSEESYIQLAVALGNNLELRQQKSAEIKAKMQNNPSFLDSKGYGAKIGELFKELFDRYSANTLSDDLRLRDVNLMVFPDWNQSEEAVGLELQQVIQTLATQPDSQKTTLLIDTTNIAIEDAEMFLSSVAMNLMMEEDLDITEELEISLIEDLSNIQWDKLLPRIDARIILECDNQAVVGKLPQEKLLQRQLESFIVNY
jgi:predicted O-linked N-acetylglucosamine transferase (SPINDLY family)/glycosyltransferase involved in cell wall biosynthesis